MSVSLSGVLGDEMAISQKAHHIVLAGPGADPCVESGDVHTSTIYETRLTSHARIAKPGDLCELPPVKSL